MGFSFYDLNITVQIQTKWKNGKRKKKEIEKYTVDVAFFGVGKLIDLGMVLKNNRHGFFFFFPPEPLLPSDECLNFAAKLLIAQVIF